jgi:1-hydroxycarotenoid 3,4-desaturase
MAEGGRASGVELADGTRIAADAVIFNGDPSALGAGLLGPEAMRAAKAVAPKHRSLSACVRAFSAEATGFALIRHTVFFGDDIFARRRPPRDPAVSVCAQDRPGRDAPRPLGPERFEITMNAPAEGDRTPLSKEDIDRCQLATFNRLEAAGLRLSVRPRPTTPQAFGALFPGTGGALYGRNPHGAMATFQRPTARSKLPGLYLAGGGTHPGPGAPMATLSGRHAAEAMLPDLASTAPSRRGGARGGTSTLSPTTGRAR